MTEKFKIYKCEICGNIVEVLVNGAGNLSCCGEEMKLLSANTGEQVKGEYHIPVVEKTDNNITVRVGAEPHPMTKEHHIEFIELISDDEKTLIHKFLDTNDEPKADFSQTPETFKVREHCNLHGLWQN